MDKKYILTIDQSTSGTKVLLIDNKGRIINKLSKKHTQYYLNDSWVEHDPIEIYNNVIYLLKEIIIVNELCTKDIAGISITNQRETVVVWDKNTGRPVYNAIVWQCRRTSDICQSLSAYKDEIQEKTGLKLDPYFSATKVKWILDNVTGARIKAECGDLLLGNIDSWLVWNLTNRKSHVTDYTNASRTLLLNIRDLKWDDRLLNIFDIPKSMLPKIYPSDEIFGETNIEGYLSENVKVSGIIGDSQGALFGQRCFEVGMAKSTFGTGNSIMINVGENFISSQSGIVSTVGYITKNITNYAVEGIVNSSGDTINWIKNELGLFSDFEEFNKAVEDVKNNEGVYFIPAFIGIGVPFWKPNARASIVGISRNTNKKHIMRAAMESIAYQVKDAIDILESESNITVKNLSVDGGVTVNDIYNQFLADLLDCKIDKNKNEELSALGSAYLGGIGLGIWNGIEEIKKLPKDTKNYTSNISEENREKLYRKWTNAMKSVLYMTELNS
ncbi:FGGY-family carbohydrate kinase [Clostridioides difficile]|uniref:FGGY-family carbohydrate kinase n=1 Tax=Clostridioides difficile TaxID=1496 RepID=UPI000C9BDC44|nr:glycerol kinase GlpK [Clostridioides difficile]MDI3074381.1 glycerol kinase GlpK [Clostridioides difficile]MDK3168751.1 glycerol kinase GlpK [Clostridioides difficile]HBF9369908.1 glycerol kinase GlpK [Clostridioides difficile]HBG1250512.1 glycerol kinase GlpK [Clostridioides difficile]HBG4142871.1 glycerol kinase GlpK [Clostridioides difficile]